MTLKILEVSGKQAFVRLGDMEIWLPFAMLKQYGVPAKAIKAGAVFNG